MLILAGTFCLAAAGALTIEQQMELSNKMIRLHVIAKSDDTRDQQLKLAVRDAVLGEMKGQKFSSRDEAQVWLQQNLQHLSETASAVLLTEHCTDPVRISLGMEQYPVRYYETFSLPAGEYLSLKVMIGEAAGKNWWCVVYPAICLSAGVDGMKEAAVSAGFSSGEVQLITERSPEIQVKFKILELIQNLRN